MIKTPYYNLHQLVLGQYTEGGEFVLEDGTDYVGLYHTAPNQQSFAGARPERTTKLLVPKRVELTTDGLLYTKIKKSNYPNYVIPYTVSPMPTNEDYTKGSIERFFLQKRNNPKDSIIEVDFLQYNSVNTTNKPGINGVVWNRTKIIWKISKIPRPDATTANKFTVMSVLQKFPYLDSFVTAYDEYYR
jgi:hypothetical protein